LGYWNVSGLCSTGGTLKNVLTISPEKITLKEKNAMSNIYPQRFDLRITAELYVRVRV